jgi:hypothetical protein
MYRYTSIVQQKPRAYLHLSQAVELALHSVPFTQPVTSPSDEQDHNRMIMLSLYIEDRHISFRSDSAYRIDTTHPLLQRPWIGPEDDPILSSSNSASSPSSSSAHSVALVTLMAQYELARHVTNILHDSSMIGGLIGLPTTAVIDFDDHLTHFAKSLPEYFLHPCDAVTTYDISHPALPAQRIRLHSYLLIYRMGLFHARLSAYLDPSVPDG